MHNVKIAFDTEKKFITFTTAEKAAWKDLKKL